MAINKNFVFVGALLTIIFLTRLTLSVITHDISFVEILNWGSIAYMAFVIAYLYPQFKEEDERTKQIKQKGMYYSVFIVLFVLVSLLALIRFEVIEMDAITIIRMMISFIIISIWTSWLILAKRM
ncbi:hypothetical protein [Ornithinibacillus bavariensis]|uniref:Permease n=1 Tax=Ornithinibacillus bavariensis TaxID=545502 RepID=A0A920C4I9_9BACI|nr:hypothetical protein [Ornithinibacillus bavariensis]GIO25675.1 hypothetical protein J43TS3_02860 [Ornithinibacillus bavariensis]HAM79918.1 hypothetical protein [Ornithinibacillus sp.]